MLLTPDAMLASARVGELVSCAFAHMSRDTA